MCDTGRLSRRRSDFSSKYLPLVAHYDNYMEEHAWLNVNVILKLLIKQSSFDLEYVLIKLLSTFSLGTHGLVSHIYRVCYVYHTSFLLVDMDSDWE